jgi:hypothetical protein
LVYIIGINKIYKLFLFLFTLLVLLKGLNFGVPSRDSGAFLYAGREILLGKTAYLDFWDHKSPLIYFINAAAVVIGQHQLWGLWFIETVCLFLAFLFLFEVLSQNFNKLVAIFTIIICGLSLTPLLEGGNRVEEYGLFFQALALFLFYKNKNKFFLGVVCFCLFLLKPNMVAFLPSVLIILFFQKQLKKSIDVIFGFVFSLFLVFISFAIKKALPDLFDQVFYFNFLYSASTFSQKFASLFFGIKLLFPLLFLSFIGFCLSKKTKNIILLSGVWLIMEILFSSISGRSYRHYYLTWIIPSSVLIASALFYLKNKILLFALFLFIFFNYAKPSIVLLKNAYALRPIDKQFQYRGFNYQNFAEHADTLKVISANTDQNDGVVIWGSEPSLLFLSSRRTSSKYYYQFRLFYPGYNLDDSKTKEFYADLINNPPKLIIDAAKSTYDSDLQQAMTIPPLNQKEMASWFEINQTPPTESLKNISNFVLNNYLPIAKTYENKWVIYERVK